MKRLFSALLIISLLLTGVQAQTVPASYFGLTINNLVGMWPQLPIASSRTWDSGVSGATVFWKDIETAKGVYTFTNWDTEIAAYKAHGVQRVVFTLGHVPGWANGNQDDSFPPTNPQDLYDFMTAFVTHNVTTNGSGFVNYGIWNEPVSSAYCNGCTVALLNTYAQNLYPIIKGIDPNALVLSPENTGDAGPAWNYTFLTSGGGSFFDVYAFHAYPWVTPGPQPPEFVFNIIAYYNQIQEAFNLGKPVWITEIAQTGTENDATSPITPAYVSVAMLAALNSGVQNYIWYLWDNGFGHNGIGTLTGTNQGLNTSGAAYRVMTSVLLNSTITSPVARQSNTNQIRNTTMTGMVAGTPGTVPTNWQTAVGAGITQTLSGPGTINGVTYFDLRIHGTATSNSYIEINPEQNTQVPAAVGQTWTYGINFSLQAGSFANITNGGINAFIAEFNSGGGGEVDEGFQVYNVTPLSIDKQNFWQTTKLTSATAAFAVPGYSIGWNNGAVIDITIRIALPYMDNGTIYSGLLTEGNGNTAEIAWDSAGGPTTFSAGSFPVYRDLAGATHAVSGSNVTLTNAPIILESSAQKGWLN